MFVRVVTITSKPGMHQMLRQIGIEKLVPINKNAGCSSIYFLESENDNEFGVVSVWEEKEVLEKMKKSDVYTELRKELDPLTDIVIDKMYKAY